MSGLKEIRNRVKSIKSTKKITKAMQMVAAAKLRKVKDAAENAERYATSMQQITNKAISSSFDEMNEHMLLKTSNNSANSLKYLLVVFSSDKGLCGAFNASIIRQVKHDILRFKQQAATVELITYGRKAYEILKSIIKVDNIDVVINKYETEIQNKPTFADAKKLKEYVLNKFKANGFDFCNLYYSQFKNAITQIPQTYQLIPVNTSSLADNNFHNNSQSYLFEPRIPELLDNLLNDNLTVQIFSAMINNLASELGARMTAMDNATNNANDMIDRLTLELNRTRQNIITKELIEIISGAEAI